jgi:hypothetical protein
MKLIKLAVSLLFSLPVIAQVNPAIPAATLVERDMLLAPASPSTPPWVEKWKQPETSGKNLYTWSVAAVIAANAADAVTSWQLHEANPLIAGPSSKFGMTSLAIKTGFVATSLILQHVALRHRPDLYRRLAWTNFITAGAIGGAASYNAGLH